VNVVTGTSRLQGETSLEGTESRLSVWGYGAEAAAERPLLGWGPGRFAAATTPRYSPQVMREGVFDSAHSWPVEYATTTGLLGLVLLLGWLGLAARAAGGPLAWFTALYGLFALVEPMSLALTPVVLLALGASGPSSRLEAEHRQRRGSGYEGLIAAAGAAAGLLIAAPYLAGERAMADAVLDTSPSAWRRADGLLPAWPEVAHLGARVSAFHGLSSDGDDHRRRALRLARQAVDRDPANARWWAHLGFLEMKWGSPAAAGAAFDEALDRLPWYPLALEGTAQLAAATDDTDGKDDACDRLSTVVKRPPDICRADSGWHGRAPGRTAGVAALNVSFAAADVVGMTRAVSLVGRRAVCCR
ncbi:MAG TPA: O-antigen ligase family protein, partial [Acidimicrobiia bacterium]|nr:O-antigen ligase family protein [Acidimicrobiia bacterium]